MCFFFFHRWNESFNKVIVGFIRRCVNCGKFQQLVQIAPGRWRWKTYRGEVDIEQCKECPAVINASKLSEY